MLTIIPILSILTPLIDSEPLFIPPSILPLEFRHSKQPETQPSFSQTCRLNCLYTRTALYPSVPTLDDASIAEKQKKIL